VRRDHLCERCVPCRRRRRCPRRFSRSCGTYPWLQKITDMVWKQFNFCSATQHADLLQNPADSLPNIRHMSEREKNMCCFGRRIAANAWAYECRRCESTDRCEFEHVLLAKRVDSGRYLHRSICPPYRVFTLLFGAALSSRIPKLCDLFLWREGVALSLLDAC
jgi:hypothetical protein